MSSLALINATTFIGGHDFTTRLNEMSIDATVEALEDTRFRASGTGRTRIGGLEDVETELSGYWESASGDSADLAAFTGLGTSREVVTHTVDGTETSVSYMYQGRKFTYQTFGEVGVVMPFTLNISGAGGNGSPGVVRGQLAAANQDVSSTGVLGSPVNLGDVASGEHLYAAFHVFTAGTSIEVDLESDSSQSFSGPTTQQSFGPLSAEGGTWVTRVSGAISDTWYRLNVTAITGTFTVAGAIGIK